LDTDFISAEIKFEFNQIQAKMGDLFAGVRVLLQFIVDNGLVASIGGYTIGAAVGTVVKSFVSDIMMPGLYKVVFLILNFTPLKHSELLSRFFRFTNLNIDGFIKEFINVTLIIYCAYLIFTRVLSKYMQAKRVADAAAAKGPSSSIPASGPSSIQQLQQQQKMDNIIAGSVVADADAG